MSLEKASDQYVVAPNACVNLGEIDTREKSLFDGNKKKSLPVMEQQLEKLKELQTKLYAQDKKKLLVVIQAMDTGGKDGCVKSVFGSVAVSYTHLTLPTTSRV